MVSYVVRIPLTMSLSPIASIKARSTASFIDALGECGLDYSERSSVPKEQQKRVFKQQVRRSNFPHGHSI
jgi:Tat protein secretion system quality control protein TatD with DNase activity